MIMILQFFWNLRCILSCLKNSSTEKAGDSLNLNMMLRKTNELRKRRGVAEQ